MATCRLVEDAYKPHAGSAGCGVWVQGHQGMQAPQACIASNLHLVGVIQHHCVHFPICKVGQPHKVSSCSKVACTAPSPVPCAAPSPMPHEVLPPRPLGIVQRATIRSWATARVASKASQYARLRVLAS